MIARGVVGRACAQTCAALSVALLATGCSVSQSADPAVTPLDKGAPSEQVEPATETPDAETPDAEQETPTAVDVSQLTGDVEYVEYLVATLTAAGIETVGEGSFVVGGNATVSVVDPTRDPVHPYVKYHLDAETGVITGPEPSDVTVHDLESVCSVPVDDLDPEYVASRHAATQDLLAGDGLVATMTVGFFCDSDTGQLKVTFEGVDGQVLQGPATIPLRYISWLGDNVAVDWTGDLRLSDGATLRLYGG